MSAGRLRVLRPSIAFGHSPVIGPASARNAHCWRCGSVRDPASSNNFPLRMIDYVVRFESPP